MQRVIGTFFLLPACLLMGIPQGQVEQQDLQFEVASVKPNPVGRGKEQMQATPTSFTVLNARVMFCIQWAYEIRSYQIKTPPGWRDQHVDIVAKTPDGATDAMRRSMMRSLLKERFGLTFHREQAPVQAYELQIAKGGPKLSASKPETVTSVRQTADSYELLHVTLAELAENLSGLGAVDHPVVDRTGLAGTFDISLRFRDGYRPTAYSPGAASTFFLLGEMGLKLELREIPTEIFVIDIEKKATEN